MGARRKTAFVLSGGGNRGAMQVGALRAHLEAGIVPDLLVGTSAGAINAAGLAGEPTPEGVERLARAWLACTKDDVYPGGRLRALWTLARTRQSLYPSGPLHHYLRRHAPERAVTFAQLGEVALYIVAVRVRDGSLHVFGDDPEEPVLEAVMASTAAPLLFPPWSYRGEQWVDGGAVADVPVRVALERGATEIYALHTTGHERLERPAARLLDILDRAVTAALRQQVQADLEEARRRRGVRLHYLRLEDPLGLPYWDYQHTAQLIEHGYGAATEALARPAGDEGGRAGLLRRHLSRWREAVNASGATAASARLRAGAKPRQGVSAPF